MIRDCFFCLFTVVFCDVPEPWQLGFQDGASPSFEGITELHDYIMFYLIIILQGVGMVLSSVIINWNAQTNKIVHKYHNHGFTGLTLGRDVKQRRHYSTSQRNDSQVLFVQGKHESDVAVDIPWVETRAITASRTVLSEIFAPCWTCPTSVVFPDKP